MRLASLVVAFFMFGCGPGGGPITGRVTVEGGSSTNVLVILYGPVSQVVLSDETGAFKATSLPDGQYLARATVRGAEVEEVSAPVKLAGGKADVEPLLAFKMKKALMPGKISGRVTAMGGTPGNVTVFVNGPQTSVAITMMDGTFTTPDLADGTYVLRAAMKGAVVEEVTAQATLTLGKLDAEPVLAFRFAMLTSSTVTGKVVFSDGSDASNLVVTLGGSTFLGTRTGPMGAFSFTNVPEGVAIVSVEAANTREGRASVGVAVTGAMVDAGELRLTPVARVGGIVSGTAGPVNGATVSIAGTGLTATTNALGRFDLDGVPVGDTTLVARAPNRLGTAMQRLARGSNMDVAITLQDDVRTGSVSGSVTFAGPQSPRVIAVSIPGLGLTTQAGQNGVYAFGAVPVGEWEVVATAPYHPRQVLGRVSITNQGAVSLPGAVLSFYEPIWDSASTLSGVSVIAVSLPWVVVTLSEPAQQRTLLINSRTKDVRVLATTGVALLRFSANARYLSFTVLNQVMTYEVTTGQLRAWANDSPPIANHVISTDESTLFIHRGVFLERIPLATGVITRFPAVSFAPVTQQTPDRWFIQEGTDVSLVEPAMVTTAMFTNVSTFSAFPTAWAMTNCVPSPMGPLCTLRISAPAGRVANTVSGQWALGQPVLGQGDFPYIQQAGAVVVLRSSDGAVFPLPTGSSAPLYNLTGTRIAYSVSVPGTTAIREEALPPTAVGPPVAQTAGTFSFFRYLTPTRLVVSEASPRRVIDVRSGVPTVDADVSTAPGPVGGALAWASTTTTTWKTFIGDRVSAIDTGVTTTGTVVIGLLARGNLPVADVGLISFEVSSAWVLGQGMPRRVFGGRATSVGERLGTLETFNLARGAVPLTMVLDATSEQLVETFEPRLLLTATGTQGVWVNVDESRRSVVMGVIR